MNEIIIRRSKINTKQEKSDLIKIHTIRGRLLHLTSILETIMKGYCNLPLNTNKKAWQIEDLFITKLKLTGNYNLKELDVLKDCLKEIRDSRNDWGHGFVYYKKRKKGKINNSIANKGVIKSITPPYFDETNKNINFVFDWLANHYLLKIKRHYIDVV